MSALTMPRAPAFVQVLADQYNAIEQRPSTHDTTSLEELQTIVTRLEARETHWEFYKRVTRSLDVSLAPDQIWVLIQICRSGPVLLSEMSARFDAPAMRLDAIAAQLVASRLIARNEEGLVATKGAVARAPDAFRRMTCRHRARTDPRARRKRSARGSKQSNRPSP